MRRALPVILTLALGGCSWIIGQPITDDGGAGDLGGGSDGGGVRPDAAPLPGGCTLGAPSTSRISASAISIPGELVDVAALPGGHAVAVWIDGMHELVLQRSTDSASLAVHGAGDDCAGPRVLEGTAAPLAVAAVCWNRMITSPLETAYLHFVDASNNVSDKGTVSCGMNTPHVPAIANHPSDGVYVFGCGDGFSWTREDGLVGGGPWIGSPAAELRVHQGPNGPVYAFVSDPNGGDLVWGVFDPVKSGMSGQPSMFSSAGAVINGAAVGDGASVFLAGLVKASPMRLRTRLGGNPTIHDATVADARTDAGRPIGVAVLPDGFVVAVASTLSTLNVTLLHFAKDGTLLDTQTAFGAISAGTHPQLAYSSTSATAGYLWLGYPETGAAASQPSLVRVPVTCTP